MDDSHMEGGDMEGGDMDGAGAEGLGGTEHEAQLAELAGGVFEAEIGRFVDELEVEQLLLLRQVMEMVADNGHIGHQISGIVTGCLMYKHQRTWNGEPTPWGPAPA